MKAANPYLNFDGNTREAMTFYGKCLDAQVEVQTFREVGHKTPPGAEDRVMHARLAKGGAVLMASDTMPGMPFEKGTNFHVVLDCDSPEEGERVFAGLSDGGRVNMPMQDTFWGARFGMLTDRYGVNWMVNCETKKA